MTRRSLHAVGRVTRSATTTPRSVGILGLQGCFVPHAKKLEALGCLPVRIVYPADLDQCHGLIMPGGESTTMLKTMTDGLWDALLDFGKRRPIWGICAGSILLANEVSHPVQQSLGLMDMAVVRNAYGAQNESFITELNLALNDDLFVEEAVFIRAPVIRRVGTGCTVIARHGENPVAVSEGLHLATTFHPELTGSLRFHQYFLDRLESGE